MFGMKNLLVALLLVCALPQLAVAFVERDVAVLRVMNKDAGKAQEIKISVGDEAQHEKLFINVRACKQSDPFEAEDYWAFLEITEDRELIYSNWMNRNEPGQNPLQHADYDVWLVRCE